MRSSIVFALLGLALAATGPSPARAACPLETQVCLEQYGAMLHRPWLGVIVDINDSTGTRKVTEVMPGSPAAEAGLQPGDVLESINGMPPKQWFAGRSGWSQGQTAQYAVTRSGARVELQVPLRAIPEEKLADLIGKHMLNEHLADGSAEKR